jgi:hypothetical protein
MINPAMGIKKPSTFKPPLGMSSPAVADDIVLPPLTAQPQLVHTTASSATSFPHLEQNILPPGFI